MVGAKSISLPFQDRPSDEAISKLPVKANSSHGLEAIRYFLLVPVCPFLGYWLLDQTGFTQALIDWNIVPQAILGEGFGHVGLCFSIHYMASGVRALWKTLPLKR